MITKFSTAALAVAAMAASAPAFAFFKIADNPGGEKFYIDIANKDANEFYGSVGNNTTDKDVKVNTRGLVDTGAGYSNIKPVKDGVLGYLLFTPTDPNRFGDFSFRGQLNDNADGVVRLVVTDNQGNTPQEFFFNGLGGPNDFARVGIISTDNETIKTVALFSDFKEVKQIEFSQAVPEPETYALMLAGLAAVGFMARRRKSA